MTEQSLNYLNGFLSAVSILNIGVNRIPTFEISLITSSDNNLEQNILEFFPQGYSIVISPINNWKQQVTTAVNYYFFKFTENEVVEGETKENLTNRFLDLLDQILVDLKQVYRLEVDSKNDFYEAQYQDFVFETGENLVLLHFGISD